MNVQVHYNLSNEGRKANILAGGNGKETQTLTVQPDDPEFARAVRLADVKSDGTASVNTHESAYDCEPTRQHWDKVPTVTEILDDLEARQAAKAAEKEAAQAKRREQTQAVLAERRTVRRQDSKSGAPYLYDIPEWPYNVDPDIAHSPEALAWEAELEQAKQAACQAAVAANQAAIAEREREERERAAAEEARRAALGLGPDEDDFEFENSALTQVPVWETHSRGKNWMATIAIDPSKSGGLDRDFFDKAKGESYYLNVDSVSPGDAIEFGADYYSGRGHKTRDRWYGYVVRIDPETDSQPGRLILHHCKTGPEAVKAGKAFRETQTAQQV